MKLTTLTSSDDAQVYARRLGFCSSALLTVGHFDALTIAALIERMAGGVWPCKVRTRLHMFDNYRYPWLSTILVEGKLGHTQCDVGAWYDSSPKNVDEAPIYYYTIDSVTDGVDDTIDGPALWLDEAEVLIARYFQICQRRMPKEALVQLDPSGMSGIIISGGTMKEVDITWHDLKGASR